MNLRQICEALNDNTIHPDSYTQDLATLVALYTVIKENQLIVAPNFDGVFEQEFRAVLLRLHDHCLSLSRDGKSRQMQLPRIDARAITGHDFKEYIKKPVPFVLEGGALGSDAVKFWTPQYLKDVYGHYRCVVSTGVEESEGTIGEIADEIIAGLTTGRYIHNVANFFNTYSEAEKQLGLSDILGHFIDGKQIGSQLFFGGAGTGSPYHCANELNIFVNIYGEKEWFFIHPDYTPWMYGFLHVTGIFAYSPVDPNVPAEQQKGTYPLYSKIPVYKTILKPGDVLFNPPWWWHAVNNKTPSTIAVATRWCVDKLNEINFGYSLAQQLAPQARENINDRKENETSFRMCDEKYRNTYSKGIADKLRN